MTFLRLLFIFFALAGNVYPADSTIVQPPTVNTTQKVTVSVLHYLTGAQQRTDKPICPANGTLISSDFFLKNFPYFPDPTADTMYYNYEGYLFFVCAETFWTTDAYYQSLVQQNWVNCDRSTGAMIGAQCTIKVLKPPLVRLIPAVPPTDYKTDANGTSGSTKVIYFFNVSLYASPVYDLTYYTYVGKNRLTQDNNFSFYTWAAPDAIPQRPTLPYQTNPPRYLYWLIRGSKYSNKPYETSAWVPTEGSGEWGYYRCNVDAPNFTDRGFGIPIPYDMYGKTCSVTCVGPWTRQTGTLWTSKQPSVKCY